MKAPVHKADRHHRCDTCGFDKVYKNAGQVEAKYWFSKHSCAKHLAATATTRRHQARMAAIDRTPKPCRHKEANHQHGTNAAYVLDGCRCEPCSAARGEADSWRRKQQAYGRYDRYVDADPVREHVRTLMEFGVGLKRISIVAGVSQGGLWKLVYGKRKADGSQTPSRRVTRTTADRLLAVTPSPENLAGAVIDDANWPLARLQLRSLVAIGWSMTELGRRLGVNWPGNAALLINSDDRPMHRHTVEAIQRVFDELSMTPAPERTKNEKINAARSRRYAQQRGWKPPLELDDVAEDLATADEELADFDEVVVLRLADGDRTVAYTITERREAVRRLHRRMLPTAEIARILGRNTHQVGDDLRFLGLAPHPDPRITGLSRVLSARRAS